MASHTIEWHEDPPDEYRRGVVTIGNFDGVHRGHACLLEEVRRQAAADERPAVALTFDPHPRELLAPESILQPLTTLDDRLHLLQALGARVLVMRTTPELLDLPAADFFHRVVERGLDASALVEGRNFGFGRGREGTVATLAQLCQAAQIPLTVIPPLIVDGREVSSSQVRQLLLRGAVSDASRLLGRPYQFRGKVGVGLRRGRTLGFPTANLEQVPTLVPRDGVYAVRVSVAGQSWPGAANIGPNPTFAEQQRKIEIHLIGYQGNLYQQSLTVDLLQRLRDTKPFANAGELVAQLRSDVEQATQIVRHYPN